MYICRNNFTVKKIIQYIVELISTVLNRKTQQNAYTNKRSGLKQNQDEPNRYDSGRTYSLSMAEKSMVINEIRRIAMFKKGIANELTRDTTASRTYLEDEESERLINIAKQNNLYIDINNCSKFGERVSERSGESIVFYNEKEESYIKLKSPFAKVSIKQTHPSDAIYEHIIHNILFPNTKYKFIGITSDYQGIRIILKQDAIPKLGNTPTNEFVNEFLSEKLKLKPDGLYFHGNDDLAITDINAQKSDNVLLGTDNNLYFIDPLIRLKKPAVEIIEKYLGIKIDKIIKQENKIEIKETPPKNEKKQQIINTKSLRKGRKI